MKYVSLITIAILSAVLTMPAQAAEKRNKKASVKVAHTAAMVVDITSKAAFTNNIGMSFVNIPSGSFVMGSCTRDHQCDNKDRYAEEDESPQHTVSIYAFQMGKTEVTLGQFKRFIKAKGNYSLEGNDLFIYYNNSGDNAPVVNVSWNDAQAFINWLNQNGESGYRLPSEAEWEYACRAGLNSKYCGGDDVSKVAGDECLLYGTHEKCPVATKQANAWGLYDMSGNANEWVQDSWHSYREAPTDGSAWEKEGGGGEMRVVRGGSLRAASRDHGGILYFQSDAYRGIGFRLARTLP